MKEAAEIVFINPNTCTDFQKLLINVIVEKVLREEHVLLASDQENEEDLS